MVSGRGRNNTSRTNAIQVGLYLIRGTSQLERSRLLEILELKINLTFYLFTKIWAVDERGAKDLSMKDAISFLDVT